MYSPAPLHNECFVAQPDSICHMVCYRATFKIILSCYSHLCSWHMGVGVAWDPKQREGPLRKQSPVVFNCMLMKDLCFLIQDFVYIHKTGCITECPGWTGRRQTVKTFSVQAEQKWFEEKKKKTVWILLGSPSCSRQEDWPVAAGLLPRPGLGHLPGLPLCGLGRPSSDETQGTRWPQSCSHCLQLCHGRPVLLYVPWGVCVCVLLLSSEMLKILPALVTVICSLSFAYFEVFLFNDVRVYEEQVSY